MEEHRNKMPKWLKTLFIIIGKIALIIIALLFSAYIDLYIFFIMRDLELSVVLILTGVFLLPAMLLSFIIFKNRKKMLKIWSAVFGVFLAAVAINGVVVYVEGYEERYEESLKVNTSPNINCEEYLPFDKKSKIVMLDHEAALRLEGDLPVIDGAAAVFPVYSAFVNAVYPDTVSFQDGVFEYHNTVTGYSYLAEKKTDIFFGAYPSEEQIAYAKEQGTEFVYTPIGSEAFVFIVHKDNPVESLTTEQIQGIYAGEITNWKEVGGNDEEIVAFQRNEGSGSQSMLIRFMDGRDLMEAPTEMYNDYMVGIIEEVADYKSKSNSIGFSFRYYVEGIIQNPDIKMLSVDGVAPTVENIKSGKYPITTPLYAVTYEGNDNDNVDKLLQWVLSEEGQELIEKTGYAGVGE